MKRKRSYEEKEKLWREREGVGTIGLDWLGKVLLGGWRGLGRIPAKLKILALSSPHSSPHLPLPNSLSSPLSTSI